MTTSATIVVTGDEVLLGRVADLNGSWLAEDLAARGVTVAETRLVGDSRDRIAAAVAAACASDAELVIVTGGLGPTHDDITAEAVAIALGVPMRVNQEALALVAARHRVAWRGQPDDRLVSFGVEKQATLPVGARPLAPTGSAPGFVVALAHGAMVVLPGPPRELQPMWIAATSDIVVAAVLARARPAWRRLLRLVDVRESEFALVRADIDGTLLARIRDGVYTREGELEVAVEGATADVAAVTAHYRARFGRRLFGTAGETVDEIVARLMRERAHMVAVAESCTGGGLGARITAQTGASGWFAGGVIAYSNTAKVARLHVPAEVIDLDGAVSSACATAMAVGACRMFEADWGVSITGIAGPGGGSAAKPVGLVFVGICGPGGTTTTELRLPGDRESVRRRAQTLALHRLRERAQSSPI
ncbi:MAG: CinA family nicotinamide mononucleotide deamidase-related protein [Actinobacteria bacterium]|nr:CinA family nicotinamide mononucleotide deamidase-related protein [Actinomycetota bacterium]